MAEEEEDQVSQPKNFKPRPVFFFFCCFYKKSFQNTRFSKQNQEEEDEFPPKLDEQKWKGRIVKPNNVEFSDYFNLNLRKIRTNANMSKKRNLRMKNLSRFRNSQEKDQEEIKKQFYLIFFNNLNIL